ncbi:MAG: O-antigen ligase family protein [Rhodocyclaceae bacterium]
MTLDAFRLERGLYFASSALLVALTLLVPLAEKQPVNAVAALFAIMAVTLLALRSRLLLRSWDAIDWAMLALFVSAVLSTVFGWGGSTRYHGIAEAAIHIVMFLYLRHGGHDEATLRRLATAVIVGTTLAASGTLVSHAPGLPIQLPGVRGSIRSALYTGITLMLCIGLALHAQGIRRHVALGVVFFLLIMTLSMASRAVSVGLGICLIIGCIAHFHNKAPKYALISIIVLVIAFALQPNSTVEQTKKAKFKELVELVTAKNISPNDQARIEIWRASWTWIARGEHVLFGIGPRNYHLIDKDRLGLDPPLRFAVTRESSHAHNLFLTRYIEQGLVGLSALIVLLVLIARHLLHDAIRRRTSWAWWAALGGWWLPFFSGMVGSPWNHDYVWLAVFTFALYEATRNRAPEACPPAFRTN